MSREGVIVHTCLENWIVTTTDWRILRVPDAVQRSPGDANGSRECAPDDRLRIVRHAAPQSRDPGVSCTVEWTPDQQRTP